MIEKKVKRHPYRTRVRWVGNRGEGTASYRGYDRVWELAAPDKPVMICSNDPLLGGDASKYNPEDLLLSALSACHMLWYLHLCADAGVVVTAYEDEPEAVGEVEPGGKGRFVSATLKPIITITRASDKEKARALHDEIHHYCFIARSVNFPVDHQPVITVEEIR